jgi:hypothetical protein
MSTIRSLLAYKDGLTQAGWEIISQRDLVDDREWSSKDEFLRGLALAETLSPDHLRPSLRSSGLVNGLGYSGPESGAFKVTATLRLRARPRS